MLFAETLSIPVILYTSNFNPHLRAHEQSLRAANKLAEGVTVINLYELLCQEFRDGTLAPIKSMRGNLPVMSTASMPLAKGMCLTREKFQFSTTDEVSGCNIFEEFLIDGKVLFRKGYAKFEKMPAVAKVCDVRFKSKGGRRFRNESEFVCDTLCRQLDKAHRWHMLVDKNRMYRRLPQAIKRHGVCATITPVIHSAHMHHDGQIKSSYSHWLGNDVSVDAIIVHTKKQIEAMANISSVKDKLTWIPHTLPQWPSDSERNISKKPTVLYAARYEKEKRHHLLFEAFEMTSKILPNAELHTYGSGSQYEELCNWVAAHNMQGRIHVHPVVANIGELCSQAWCGVLASAEESFSLFILECLAHGCPVVSFDIDYGPRELLNDGEGGVLVPDSNVPALAAALTQLLSNPKMIQSLSASAISAARRFMPSVISNYWMLWYEKMISISKERYGANV
jgi:glycosyltransferase involved in cell wall biosynthesis